jgi:hypothetical protein
MFVLKPDWLACAVISIGNLGGLLVSWDPHYFDFSTVLTCGRIIFTGSIFVDRRSLTLLDVYGQCMDRKTFWKKCVDKGIMLHNDLIMAGDLNFTLNAKEIWGTAISLDPLATFFKDLFANTPMVDVAPT